MKNLIIILGPTGVGKTDISIEIAKFLNTEIISSDSRQIYKELKIGTAVPSDLQLNTVKHYFIASKSIFDYYNASMYEFEVLDLLDKLFENNDNVLLVGGSGMYIDAVCKGIDDLPTIDAEVRQTLNQKFEDEGIESIRIMLKKIDPEYYSKVDLRNSKRILKGLEVSIMTGKPYSSFLKHSSKVRNFNIIKIGFDRNREELHNIINKRVDKMLEEGLLQEAEQFYQYKKLNSLNTVGYREIFDYMDNVHNFETAIELIKRNTRRYARRQLTWFHKDKDIKWFNPENKTEVFEFVKTINSTLIF